jgi:hypothetical protein
MADQFVIIPGDQVWRVLRIRDDEVRHEDVTWSNDATSETRVESTRDRLINLEYADQPILLALPSSWCLCASITTEGLERRGRRRAMSFRLEEHLPISAEDVAADYFEFDKALALGVCSELERLRKIVDAFENAEMHVRHIIPDALLAATAELQRNETLDSVLMASLPPDADRAEYDIVETANGKLTNWWWFAEDQEAAAEELESWGKGGEPPLKLATIGDERALQWVEHCNATERHSISEMTFDQAVARQAARVLTDETRPWIDLRCDALPPPSGYATYRKPLAAAMVACLLLVASVIGVTQWRGRQYQALASEYEQNQIKLFEETLEQSAPRRGIKSRMISERRKLAGLGGQASGDHGQQELKDRSALVHLYNVLRVIPRDQRYRLLELRISPETIRVDGEARSYAKAEQLAVALRETGAYEVAAPETESLRDRGVSFLFSAKPLTQTTQTKEASR